MCKESLRFQKHRVIDEHDSCYLVSFSKSSNIHDHKFLKRIHISYEVSFENKQVSFRSSKQNIALQISNQIDRHYTFKRRYGKCY